MILCCGTFILGVPGGQFGTLGLPGGALGPPRGTRVKTYIFNEFWVPYGCPVGPLEASTYVFLACFKKFLCGRFVWTTLGAFRPL